MNKKIAQKKFNALFLLMAAACLALPIQAHAQPSTTENVLNPALKLDFPVIDYPFLTHARKAEGDDFSSRHLNPSMNQSVAITAAWYSSFHYGMKQLYDNELIGEVSYNYFRLMGDALLTLFPLGGIWAHEEFHRAVFRRHDIDSYNSGWKDFNYFGGGYAQSLSDVSRLLQTENWPDNVRLSSAGFEGQYLVVDKLQRENFFYDLGFSHIGHYLTTKLSALNYFHGDIYGDGVGGDMIGDPLAWTLKLFRPGEWTEPGSTFGDLTDSEQSYLKSQFFLHIINFASPMLFDIDKIPLGDDLYFNLALRYLLTSFGTVFSTQTYWKTDAFKAAALLHFYMNYETVFPALEIELVEHPVRLGNRFLLLSPRGIIGTQPKGQQFRTKDSDFLGLIGLRADFMLVRNLFPYIDFSVKTDGWVAGYEYLNSTASWKFGLSARF